MNDIRKKLVISASAILLASSAPLVLAATKEDVSKARASCAQHKARVIQMERKGNKSEGLTQAKKDWEAACNQAEVLINELNGTSPPKVVAPAPA